MAKPGLVVLDSLMHGQQKWSASLIRLIQVAKSALKPGRHLDALSALLVAEKALTGPPSPLQLSTVELALHLGNAQKLVKAEDWQACLATLERLREVAAVLAGQPLADSSFLYWHQGVLLPLLATQALSEPAWAPLIPNLVEAATAHATLLSAARHVASPAALVDGFRSDCIANLREELVQKLCAAVEVELRLSTHGHLQLDDRSPFKPQPPGAPGQVPLRPFFSSLRPLVVCHRLVISLKAEVEAYLARTFYNLCAVALADWPKYADMAAVARDKLGLDIQPPALPAHTLDHGLDLLEIMRNLPAFVARYRYHLNTQTFVERMSKSRHLNTLGISHVANSIRAHGTGIMNTTVNFTYQFLRKKFYVFSQFLYDDQIKSRLFKDVRYFRENKDALDGKYPVQRAEAFNRSIRKLGLTPDGASYLDQFRSLISEIGNALGYVRLVRNAGRAVAAESTQFLPDLDDAEPLLPAVQAAACFRPATLDAARHYDALVLDLLSASSTQYFQLLVDVFAQQFRNPNHLHLASFYIIIPPLVVNYVEALVADKERLGKRAPDGDFGAFTDDGFPMGLAYILRLLDQYEEFDGLQWFRSIETKLKAERSEMVRKQRSAGDEKLSQTLALSLKRLATYQREFQLVRFGLRSARIFFRLDPGSEALPKDRSDGQSVAGSTSTHHTE